jgi:molybdate transport system substrate-binding protein
MGPRINAGEPLDSLVAAPAQIDKLSKGWEDHSGNTDGSRPLRHRRCVRAGAPKPDVSSVDAFTRALVAARAIAYLKEAQSAFTWQVCSSGLELPTPFDRS